MNTVKTFNLAITFLPCIFWDIQYYSILEKKIEWIIKWILILILTYIAT